MLWSEARAPRQSSRPLPRKPLQALGFVGRAKTLVQILGHPLRQAWPGPARPEGRAVRSVAQDDVARSAQGLVEQYLPADHKPLGSRNHLHRARRTRLRLGTSADAPCRGPLRALDLLEKTGGEKTRPCRHRISHAATETRSRKVRRERSAKTQGEGPAREVQVPVRIQELRWPGRDRHLPKRTHQHKVPEPLRR